MQIQLIHTEAPKIDLKKMAHIDGNIAIDEQELFELGLRVFADEKRKEVFGVLFMLQLRHRGEFLLTLDYLAWFEAEQPIEKAFLDSPFAKVNAPAIAFPYLRSFVSFLTLNSGYRPAILPTVNFMKMLQGNSDMK